jgi:hypothetical protein
MVETAASRKSWESRFTRPRRHGVMAGPGPAIHVFSSSTIQDVDARDKRGHDGIVAVGATSSRELLVFDPLRNDRIGPEPGLTLRENQVALGDDALVSFALALDAILWISVIGRTERDDFVMAQCRRPRRRRDEIDGLSNLELVQRLVHRWIFPAA